MTAAGANDILDTRILTKPKPWNGDKADYRRFSFQLYSYTQALSPKLMEVMKRAAELEAPIDQSSYEPADRALDAKLHTILSMLVEGAALEELMNVPEGCGLEAWRRYARTNQPKTVGHQRAQLIAILSPNLPEGDFELQVSKWERMIRDYELTGAEAVPDSIKMGVFQTCIAPASVHEHLSLSASANTDNETMRDEVKRVLLSRAGAEFSRQGGGALFGGPSPMDVDTLWNKGKGKGKGT